MNEQLIAHIYVLSRFARLDAPHALVEQELERVMARARGERARIEPLLRAALAHYRHEKEPRLTRARHLFSDTFPHSPLETTDDPCEVAKRAIREGWLVHEAAKLEQIRELGHQCDELDAQLREALQRACGV